MRSKADQLRRGFEMDPEVVIEALRECGEELDPEIDAALGMQGARLAPRIFALIREQLAETGAAEWGAIHAVRFFGEDRFVPAVEVILEVALATKPLETLHDAALTALGQIGPPAAPESVASGKVP